MTTFDSPQFVSNEEWLDARKDLLDAEKHASRAHDALAERRRAMPWQEVSTGYEFQSPDGTNTLADLFNDHRQLVIYHFMFEPSWDEGCPSCTFWADSFSGTGVEHHLANRATAFACVSNASVEQIEAYKSRMDWKFPWYSAEGTTFTADLRVGKPAGAEQWSYNFGTHEVEAESLPGLSVFGRSADGRIGLTYQAFARGLEPLNVTYGILDLTPAGRDEDDLSFSMAWLERRNP